MAYDPNCDTCASCLAFFADPEFLEEGNCHRHPPVFIARDNAWVFPRVAIGNTCADHVPTEMPDDRTCH